MLLPVLSVAGLAVFLLFGGKSLTWKWGSQGIRGAVQFLGRGSVVLQLRQMPEFSAVAESYGLEGTKVRFLVFPADKIPAWVRALQSLEPLGAARHVQWDACQPLWRHQSGLSGFPGVRVPAGYLSSKLRNGVAQQSGCSRGWCWGCHRGQEGADCCSCQAWARSDVLKTATLFPGPSARNEKPFMFCGGGEHNLS